MPLCIKWVLQFTHLYPAIYVTCRAPKSIEVCDPCLRTIVGRAGREWWGPFFIQATEEKPVEEKPREWVIRHWNNQILMYSGLWESLGCGDSTLLNGWSSLELGSGLVSSRLPKVGVFVARASWWNRERRENINVYQPWPPDGEDKPHM